VRKHKGRCRDVRFGVLHRVEAGERYRQEIDRLSKPQATALPFQVAE
jgi:hypothetical protein